MGNGRVAKVLGRRKERERDMLVYSRKGWLWVVGVWPWWLGGEREMVVGGGWWGHGHMGPWWLGGERDALVTQK